MSASKLRQLSVSSVFPPGLSAGTHSELEIIIQNVNCHSWQSLYTALVSKEEVSHYDNFVSIYRCRHMTFVSNFIFIAKCWSDVTLETAAAK